MSRIFNYLRFNQTKFFLYSRIVLNLLLASILVILYGSENTTIFKVIVFTTIISVFMTLFWGIIFTNRKFEKRVAKTIIIVDWLLVYFAVYPSIYSSSVFIFLPAVIILATTLLIPRKELVLIFGVFTLVYFSAEITYSYLGIVNQSAVSMASGFMVLAIIAGLSYILLQAFEELDFKYKELHKSNDLLKKRYGRLEKELLLNKQYVETLNKDVKKKDIEIKNILNLSGQLNIRNDSRKVITSFLLTAIGQIGSAHALIMTRRKKEQNFIDVFVEKGLRGYELDKIRIYFHSNLIQVLSSIREPVLTKLLPRDGLYEDEIELLGMFSKDLICPIFVRGSLAGVFIIGTKVSGAPFVREDVSLAAIIANQMSFVLEQTQTTYEYQDFYSKTLRAMLRSLEAKYIYARGHNIRTANYVNIMAKIMGLPNNEIKDMSYGALLHDIGKIAVKDEYLLNTAKLADSENGLKEKILQHTVKGSNILKAAGFNETIIDMALHHHEFYDGGGYPNQIGRDELETGTKILSVCNAFDAMTSDRPHRRALKLDTAKEHLRYYSGTQFDPEMVKIFLNEYENNPAMHKAQKLN